MKQPLPWKARLSGYIDTPDPALPTPTPTPSPSPTTIGTWNGMHLTHWQASNDHINYARDLFTQPKFRDLLAVLTNSRPRPVTRGISDTEAAISLGIYQGYDLLLGTLLTLPTYPTEAPEEVQATYGSESFDINTQV